MLLPLSPRTKAPGSCDMGQTTASGVVTVDCRITCPLAPHRCAVAYSLILPPKAPMTFQWISMWTCEDTCRESGNKSLNNRLFLIRVIGSAEICPNSHWVRGRNTGWALTLNLEFSIKLMCMLINGGKNGDNMQTQNHTQSRLANR